MAHHDDPRDTITPASFAVSPELIGTPLAGPWRRAVAMSVDLVLAAMLSLAGGVLLAAVAAVLLFRAAARSTNGFLGRSRRAVLWAGGAVAVVLALLGAWDWVTEIGQEDTGAGIVVTGVGGAMGLVGDLLALQRSEDEDQARRIANRLVRRLDAGTLTPREIRELRESLDDAVQSMQAGTEAAVAGVDLEPHAVRALRDAIAALDTATAAPETGTDTLARLTATVSTLRERNARLAAELDEARQDRPGPLRYFLSALAEDLGLGVAWFALYFTAFLVVWRGHTPGKRLAGVRVTRLDGRPLNWWHAFERFGGYSASLATLGVGFLQIFWDRNRQGIHDKIVETVVIRE